MLALNAYKIAARTYKLPLRHKLLEQKANFSKEEMDQCAMEMRALLKGKVSIKAISLKKKFGGENMLKVSKMKAEIK